MIQKIFLTILMIIGVVAVSLSMSLSSVSHAMINPMISFATIDEAETAAGTMALTLPDDYTLENGDTLTLTHVFTIAEKTIDLRYTKSDENGEKEICLRTAAKNDPNSDIENLSGVYNDKWEMKLIKKATIFYTTANNDVQAASWSDRGRYFSATATGLTENEFMDLLQQIVF